MKLMFKPMLPQQKLNLKKQTKIKQLNKGKKKDYIYFEGFCHSHQILCMLIYYGVTFNALLTVWYMVGDQQMFAE